MTPRTAQAALRNPQRPGTTPRLANTPEHHAWLATRLTARDRWLLAVLHEHRVLTSSQITAAAFSTRRAAQHRLRQLHHWSVLDRFQPFTPVGSAPHHYVLGPAGAAILAAEHGTDPTRLGYRRTRTLGIAHSLRLAHTLGSNDFFTTLLAATPATETVVESWWSEHRCAHHYGDLVRPDAYGRIHHPTTRFEFFLEHDTGTETLYRLATKLPGYHDLAAATGITTPVLFWLPSTTRETHARTVLRRTHDQLPNPDTLPIATANRQPTGDPSRTRWLPLHPNARPHRLTELATLWPARSTTTEQTTAPDHDDPLLPAPHPHAPEAPQRRPRHA